MAYASVDAEFDSQEISKFLDGLDARFNSIARDKRFGRMLAPIVFKDVIDHFNKEKGPDGSWPKWSSSYADFMSRIGKGGNRLLQDSGRLRQNFKASDFRSESRGLIWYNDAKTKSGFPYAYAHDNDVEKRSSLPQRKFMWLSDMAMEMISQKALDYLESSESGGVG